MTGSDQNARVARLVAPLVEPMGLVLEDVAVTPAGKRRLVRISVDTDVRAWPEDDHTSVVPPMSLDEVAAATQVIAAALDEEEPLGQAPYVLEVTSPGVHRALTEPRHYRRNVGRLASLRLAAGAEVTGRLIAATPQSVTLQDAARSTTYALADIARAQVQVEFTRADGADEADDEEI